uniref:Uncharacterized protein n=1 Tax=Kalanchoe fedtschenkoi TaxID=63787 RepID=A0A7N0ZX03_KALFE
MAARYFVVDAFTDVAFKGNPAVVCVLDEQGKSEEWMKNVAVEFNQPMTCYVIPQRSVPKFELRWFSPNGLEMKLCGHATLAAIHVIGSLNGESNDVGVVNFSSASGPLNAKRVVENDDTSSSSSITSGKVSTIELIFPLAPTVKCSPDELTLMSKALAGARVVEQLKTIASEEDFFVVLESGKDVEEFEPNFEDIKKWPGRGMIVTARADDSSHFDFISRMLAPKFGIPEDHVCGSAHCALAPYWSQKLGKTDLVAYQASSRGGILKLHVDANEQKVHLQGKAITVMEGFLHV